MENGIRTVFSDRIAEVPKSFIREILKVASDPSFISFAGGLPNKDLFPTLELREAALRVFDKYGADVLQYGNSEGYLGLRKIIAERYRRDGLKIAAEDILITNGSQQGLDLIGKVFIDEGDDVVIEEPGYLGAIQAFSVYRPRFRPVPLNEDGMDISALKSTLEAHHPKLAYVVPNFQNPSGISYSRESRLELATLVRGTNTVVVEDDPYRELQYSGATLPPVMSMIPENTIALGSFSKTAVPGFRLGWIVARPEIMDKLIVAKQACDLHTNQLTQFILHQYLSDNDADAHIAAVRLAYGTQLNAMLESIEAHFPRSVRHTHPRGGMFVWASLPENASSREVLAAAMKEKVVFVPGDQFYVNGKGGNTMRLNFTSADAKTIETGIKRIGKAIRTCLG